MIIQMLTARFVITNALPAQRIQITVLLVEAIEPIYLYVFVLYLIILILVKIFVKHAITLVMTVLSMDVINVKEI